MHARFGPNMWKCASGCLWTDFKALVFRAGHGIWFTFICKNSGVYIFVGDLIICSHTDGMVQLLFGNAGVWCVVAAHDEPSDVIWRRALSRIRAQKWQIPAQILSPSHLNEMNCSEVGRHAVFFDLIVWAACVHATFLNLIYWFVETSNISQYRTADRGLALPSGDKIFILCSSLLRCLRSDSA